MTIRPILLGLLMLASGSGALAQAADTLVAPTPDDTMLQATSFFDAVDEVRVGGAFHRAYPAFIINGLHKWDFSHFEDVTFDVLFKTPQMDAFSWIGSPRPNFGATVSLTGHESMVHLGLTWQAHIFDLPVFVEGTFGGALNNGYLHDAPPGFANMGCSLGFYTQFTLGVDLPNNMTATATYEHTSNNGICNPNNGLTDVDLKLGWKF